jgi:hypothetical protein
MDLEVLSLFVDDVFEDIDHESAEEQAGEHKYN